MEQYEEKFTSQYEHKIDAKNRMFIPSEYREMLAGSVYLCKGTDGNLFIMTVEDWQAYQKKIAETLSFTSDRDVFRFFYGTSEKEPVDSQGRILIPQGYMEHAGLTTNAVIIGCGDRAEIWSPERWQAYLDNFDMEAMTKKLAENKL